MDSHIGHAGNPAHAHADEGQGLVPAAGRAGHDTVLAAIAHFDLDVTDMATAVNSYSSTVRLLTLAGGRRVVLKVPYVRQKLFREMAALEALKSDLPVPDLLDVWIPEDDTSGALLLSYLPGTVAAEVASPALAWEMGRLLAAMHNHPLPRFGEVYQAKDESASPHACDQDWWALMMGRFELWRTQCEGIMPTDLLAAAVALFEQLAENLPEPDGPLWTHNDYRPGNVLVEGENITGLIDFESARGGSADRDFVKISHYLWERIPETKGSFLNGYAAVRPLPAIEQTLPFYQLLNAIGGVAWCVRRTDTDDPFFRENMAIILRLTAQATRDDNILR